MDGSILNSLQTKLMVLTSITYSKSPTNIPHSHVKEQKKKKNFPKLAPSRIFPVFDGKIKPLVQRDPLEDADPKDTRILVTAISFRVMWSGDVRIKTFAEHSMIIMRISFHHATLNGPNRSFFNATGKFTNQDARSGIVLSLKSQQDKPVAGR